MIVTLLTFFHMGSVECVTCHLPWSHVAGGGSKVLGVAVLAAVGARSLMCAEVGMADADACSADILAQERGTPLSLRYNEVRWTVCSDEFCELDNCEI